VAAAHGVDICAADEGWLRLRAHVVLVVRRRVGGAGHRPAVPALRRGGDAVFADIEACMLLTNALTGRGLFGDLRRWIVGTPTSGCRSTPFAIAKRIENRTFTTRQPMSGLTQNSAPANTRQP
jgi:hypothetical protein